MPIKIPSLKSIITGGVTEFVKTAGSVIDNLTTSKEEKDAAKLAIDQAANAHIEKMEELVLRGQELENADRDSARDMNAKVQESEKASWLSKNVGYILDLAITTAFFSLIGMIAYKVVPEENKELFYMVVGILGAKWGDVVGFHRGSSKGSEEKAKSLDRMARKVA